MIPVKCSNAECAKSFTAKDEFAGRKTKCPKCGTPLVVPNSSPTAVSVPLWIPAISVTSAAASSGPEFYCILNGKKFGPLTWKQMQERVASRQLKPKDMILVAGTPRWVEAHEVSGLFAQVADPALAVSPQPSHGPEATVIPVKCPNAECAKTFTAKDEFAGRKTKCPKCGTALVVPNALPATVSVPLPVARVAPVPSAVVPPPLPAERFYYTVRNQSFGPLSLTQMLERVASHKLRPDDQVRREGTQEWVAAREVALLFPKDAKTTAASADEIPMALPVEPTAEETNLGQLRFPPLREPSDERGYSCYFLLKDYGEILYPNDEGFSNCYLSANNPIGNLIQYQKDESRPLNYKKGTSLIKAITHRARQLSATARGEAKQEYLILLALIQYHTIVLDYALPPPRHRLAEDPQHLQRSTAGFTKLKGSISEITARWREDLLCLIENAIECCEYEQWKCHLRTASQPRAAQAGKGVTILMKAVGHFEQGDKTSNTVINLLREAIQDRLPSEADLVMARLHLSEACGRRFGESKHGEADHFLLESSEQLEKAAKLDAKSGQVLLSRHFLHLLPPYDQDSSFKASDIEDKHGPDAAIAFLEEKLKLFSHVPGDRLIRILQNLGERYHNRYADRRLARKAQAYFERVLASRPVPGCESDYEESKGWAKTNLAIIEARATRLESPLLIRAFTALGMTLMGYHLQGKLSTQNCVLEVGHAYLLGWIAAKSRQELRRAESLNRAQIGNIDSDNYSSDEMMLCLELAMEISQRISEGRPSYDGQAFLAKNHAACEVLGCVSGVIEEDPSLTAGKVGEQLAAAFCLGYVAAKCPECLPVYYKMFDQGRGKWRTDEENASVIPVNRAELIEFECPKCGEIMEIKSRMAGRKVRCLKCDRSVRVPGGTDDRRD